MKKTSKQITSYLLAAALPLISLSLVSASPRGGIVTKVDWLLAQFGEGDSANEDAGRVPPLGTIIASALPYEFMPDSFKKTWYPADGRSLEGTGLGNLLVAKAGATTTYSHLFSGNRPKAPDLRGVFIRGLNVLETGTQERDPKERDPEERSVGDYQADSFEEHQHAYIERSVGGNFGEPGADKQGVPKGATWPRREGTYQTAKTGRKETRPKNSAVFYYIRVN